MSDLTQAAIDVLAERQRQIEAEGWTLERDDEQMDGELALASSCYAQAGCGHARLGRAPSMWPWDISWWKPSQEKRRNLVKSAALLLAEIERLDRAAEKEQQ